jgi:hypothetical protein
METRAHRRTKVTQHTPIESPEVARKNRGSPGLRPWVDRPVYCDDELSLELRRLLDRARARPTELRQAVVAPNARTQHAIDEAKLTKIELGGARRRAREVTHEERSSR